MELFRDVNIDWLGKKWIFLGCSLIFSVAGVLSLLFWHHLPLDVGFQGGTQVRVRFEQKPDVDRIRSATDHAGLRDTRITTFNNASANSASTNEVIISLPQRDTKEITLDAGRRHREGVRDELLSEPQRPTRSNSISIPSAGRR